MHRIAIFIFALAALACGQEPEVKTVKFKLFATNLGNCDAMSKCDAVVQIYYMSMESDWTKWNETSEMKDDNFPIWPETFTFDYTVGKRNKWQFKLIDKDVSINDMLDSQELSVEAFVEATQTQFTHAIPLAGKLEGLGAHLYVDRY